jgi:hypothetical protein
MPTQLVSTRWRFVHVEKAITYLKALVRFGFPGSEKGPGG